MSIKEKLDKLAALATQLEEAKKDQSDIVPDESQDDQADDVADGDQDKTNSDDEDQDGKSDSQEKSEKAKGEEDDRDDANESKTEVAPIDLGPLFEGQEFSEEFKTKATAIFEAAVAERVKQESASLQESMEVQLQNEATSISESLVEKVDGYLDYMVEQWMENNALAIDRGIKAEIMESFMSQLKNVFESHYIDVPDEKYDLVEATQQEAEELAEKLDSAIEENVELRAILKDTVRTLQVEEAAKGLVATDADKFRELAESLTYSDAEEFETKLASLKESYFSKKAPAKTELKEEFMSDTPAEVVNTPETITESVDPLIAQYAKVASRK